MAMRKGGGDAVKKTLLKNDASCTEDIKEIGGRQKSRANLFLDATLI